MSRRSANLQRLSTAGEAAVIADAWIFAEERAATLASRFGKADARAHGATLLSKARVAQQFPNSLAVLIDLFTSHPKLAPFLATPETFASLIRHTGAAIAGAPMAAIVNRFEVSVLIANLGEAAWRFGLDHALPDTADSTDTTDDDTPPLDVDQIVATIEAEGCATVYSFLGGVSPALATSAFSSAGIDFAPRAAARGDTWADASKRVLMVTERAAP